MKAAVYYGARDLRVEETAAPGALGSREILIRPLYCGICGSDLHEYTDGPIIASRTPHPYTGKTLPQILGHEFSAEVIEVGAEVRNARPGDRVSIQPVVVPPDDFYVQRGQHALSTVSACVGFQTKWGGMAELAVVDDYNVFRMPEGFDPRLGALIEPASIALSGVEKAGVSGGSSVLITGAGPIGALAALACAAFGASSIFVSEPNPVRRRQIEALGIGAIPIDPRAEDVGQVVRSRTRGGLGADAAIECSGVEPGFTACVDAVRKVGTIAQIALFTRKISVDPNLWASKGLTLRGVWGPSSITDWPRLMDMVASGRFPVGKVITSEVDLDDVVKGGFEKLCDPANTEMKVLVRI